MRNILGAAAIIICLSLGVWQMNMEGVKESPVVAQEKHKSGMQCPALYGVAGQSPEENLPSAVRHCKCEIGAMLEQKDGSFRCSYCGKIENE